MLVAFSFFSDKDLTPLNVFTTICYASLPVYVSVESDEKKKKADKYLNQVDTVQVILTEILNV